jgi:hypothetical protein
MKNNINNSETEPSELPVGIIRKLFKNRNYLDEELIGISGSLKEFSLLLHMVIMNNVNREK